MFGEPDLFLSLYNPLYFMEVLGADGRSMLEQLLPPVEQAEVLASMTESERALLQGESLLMPDFYMKQKRAENLHISGMAAEMKGKWELLDRQEQETAEKVRDILEKREELQRELAALLQKKEAGIDMDALTDRREQLRQAYEAALRAKPVTPDTSGLDQSLRETEAALLSLNQRKPDSTLPQLQALTEQLQTLVQQHQKLAARLKGLRSNPKCPACGSALTEERTHSMREKLREELAGVQQKGEAVQARYNSLLEQSEREQQTFEQKRQEGLSRLTQRRDALLEQRRELISRASLEGERWSQDIQAIRAELSTVEKKLRNGNLTDVEGRRAEELAKQQSEADVLLQELQGRNFSLEKQACMEQMTELSQRAQKNKALITAASAFWFQQSELQMKQLSTIAIGKKEQYSDASQKAVDQGFPRSAEEALFTDCYKHLRLQLHEVVKTTGEYRNVFRLTYKGRAFRLSCSERLRAGLEFVGLLQRLSGRCYPVCIDEADNMTNLPRPGGQILFTRFYRDIPLSVRIDNQRELIPILSSIPEESRGDAA